MVRLFPVPAGVTAALLVLTGCQKQAQAPAPKPAIPVTVAKVVQRTIPVQIRTIGNVEAYSTISVKAQVSGELTHVYFTEGDYVKKGQELFKIDPRQYEEQVKQAEANLAKDAANSENAQADAQRFNELFQRGVVSKQEYQAKAATSGALEATLSADRASIDNARLQVEFTSIRSPIDGRTGNLAVKQGNLIKANDIPLVTINQIHPIYVTFSVPQSDFTEINQRMRNRLPVDAIIDKNERNPVRGALTFADNTVDQTTATIRLKGTFANNDNRLWPGQFVNVVLTVTQQPNAVLVPSQAVQTGQNGQFVFVVKPDSKVEMRPVVIGRPFGNEIALSSGVAPGDTVVTDGQSRLVPGAQVQVLKTAAQAEGAPPGL
ncbi:MAG: efflux RND transporter periplasmic adaptor subunit [Bryobacteraceae bacterium]